MKSKGANCQALTEMFLERLQEAVAHGKRVCYMGWDVTAVECLSAYKEGAYLLHYQEDGEVLAEEINALGYYTIGDFLELTALFTY